MANKDITMWIIIGLLAFAVFTGNKAPATPSSTPVDLSGVMTPSATFKAQNLYAQTTAVTSLTVRAIRTTGGNADMGAFSTNANETLYTSVGKNYKLYWGLAGNGASYYPEVESYNAPASSATDKKIGNLCAVDTAPTVTFTNNLDQVATNFTFGTGDDKTGKLKIEIATKKCYGAPDTDIAGTNAICLRYNTSQYKTVAIKDAAAVAVPYGVQSSYNANGKSIVCYELKKMANGETVDLKVNVVAMSAINPGTDDFIDVYLKDISVGLNSNTLEQINGFADNDNSVIGQAAVAYAAKIGMI